MHKIILTILMTACGIITTTALASTKSNVATPGFYLNVELGVSNVAYKNNFAPGYQARSVNKSGFAKRIEGGFDIWKNFGVLMSIIYFYKPEFQDINHVTNSKVKNNVVFFALRGMLPIGHLFMIYLNGGIGYVARSAVIINGVRAFENREIVRPVYGLGARYLIWKRWALTANWIQIPQKPSDHLPTSNYVGGGLLYKFAS